MIANVSLSCNRTNTAVQTFQQRLEAFLLQNHCKKFRNNLKPETDEICPGSQNFGSYEECMPKDCIFFHKGQGTPAKKFIKDNGWKRQVERDKSRKQLKILNALRKINLLQRHVSAMHKDYRKIHLVTNRIKKQCNNHDEQMKLCWSAMDQLCIDNEAFSRELQQQKLWLQNCLSTVLEIDESRHSISPGDKQDH
ncbi:hypothetical protein O6H91_09G033900 [Diphasiastrum complanatum]|uniref:Uncharacterized protein n=1 Tax=Diphasiastrum complanatum TaxID=34168 RepID=A0ACC2CMY0_DIPCM|nr:hypothetical protein O6H91_09G033900 [Diphasiastrum complanatum]